MEANDIVGKCKHCGDPIYRFQAVAHEGCIKEYEFNPDYLDFQKGVEAGRTVGKQAGLKEVVEFVEATYNMGSEWRAKLKEWDIALPKSL